MSETSNVEFTTDTGPFAIIPEWVIDSEISHGALRLYAVLARYADTEGQAWPSRKTLANRLGVSRDTIDRYLKELQKIEAVHIYRRMLSRRDPDKGTVTTLNQTNVYTVKRAMPIMVAASMRPPCRSDAATGGLTSAAQNENHLEREPVNDMFEIFWNAYGKKVGKKKAKEQWRRHVTDEITANLAILKATQQAALTEQKFRKDPERWIRDHRWEDDEVMAGSGSAGTMQRLQALVDKEGLANE